MFGPSTPLNSGTWLEVISPRTLTMTATLFPWTFNLIERDIDVGLLDHARSVSISRVSWMAATIFCACTLITPSATCSFSRSVVIFSSSMLPLTGSSSADACPPNAVIFVAATPVAAVSSTNVCRNSSLFLLKFQKLIVVILIA